MPEVYTSSQALLKTLFWTLLALVAFAANSVLCRLALGEQVIDAASFTAIRLLSGAVALWIIIQLSRNKAAPPGQRTWLSAFMLFVYAACFSLAYITLETGTGALVLFGAVQLTLIIAALIAGDQLHRLEWAGMVTAFAGFVYLVLPNLSTPSFSGFLLMTLAGMAWGGYTFLGRGSRNPLADTARNFNRTLPFVVMLMLLGIRNAHLERDGVLLAVLSGAVASGVGYTVWYMALRGLSSTQAAVSQLSVPLIAALGGIVFVHETVSLRLMLAAAMILGGTLFVVAGRRRHNKKPVKCPSG
jgi:drug/metabolite transporter (DMT)-like permease